MALKDKGTAYEGFAALYDGTQNATAVLFETVETKCVLDYELVQLVHNHGGRPLKGLPLGLIPDLWPHDMLKQPLKEQAEEFVRQIASRGYEPYVPVTAFTVWGPYMEKVGALREWVPEEGNHVIPAWARQKAERVWSYQGDEWDWRLGCAFRIVGQFTHHARDGKVDEQTGVLVV